MYSGDKVCVEAETQLEYSIIPSFGLEISVVLDKMENIKEYFERIPIGLEPHILPAGLCELA